MDFETIIQSIGSAYVPLSQSCIEELQARAVIRPYPKNHILTREGQFDDTMYYIIAGVARAYYLKNGKDITDWFAFSNDFICPLDCFFLQKPSNHYIELLEPSSLMQINKENVMYLSDKYREFDRLGKEAITKTMLHLQKRVVSIQFESASQRYESLMLQHPGITQKVALMHIASYLGITLETLSRIRGKSRI